MQQKIDRLTDILRRDDGISGAMSYTEQISWILFLKYLNDYEDEKANEALINGKKYTYILDKEHRWSKWACPKDESGKTNLKLVKSGEDLTQYVNKELFPYLKKFKSMTIDPDSVKYKIGEIFEFLNNKIANGHTLREALDIIDELNFQSKDDLFELSLVYENLLQLMGRDAGNSGEFYTPRALIKAITKAVNPQVGKTVYDPAAGSCGFLIESFELMKKQKNLSVTDWNFLNNKTFFGIEKTPLGFVMGVMNMILHGIESPNIQKRNTLTSDIRQIQEKDRFDYILANPPFGGKEHAQVQQNFPVQSNATELLFMQHFMKNLKLGGKAGIVVPEGILFNTNNAFQEVKKQLLDNFNLHTIVSLPAGVFLPYSGVKTNVIFFDRNGSTQNIWYYEVKPSYKLTKNKPIIDEHFADFLKLFNKRKDTNNSWTVKINDIQDYDLSAKNPNNKTEIDHLPPTKILENIRTNEKSVSSFLNEIEDILKREELIMSEIINQNLFNEVKELIAASKNNIIRSVNTTMVYTYFEIGRLIVEHIQKGEDRASYGKQVLKSLSKQLTKEFGKGFSTTNLEQMRTFFEVYSKSQTLSGEFKTLKSSTASRISETNKSQTLSAISKNPIQQTPSAKFVLSWSHYVFLMRIDNKDERRFYEIEAYENNWSLRELKRQFDSSLFERLALSRDKKGVKELAEKGQIIENPKDIIKDPYILEFLGLPEYEKYSESDLENKLISKLEHFLLELGKGFTFVARQKRITYNEKHFFIDLVFYNRLLKAFVIIDLKIGEIKHQDLGQMQMYVNYYDREVKLDEENKTIGIVICKQKDNALVEMTLPENNKQIFASKYDLFLPNKQELKKLIEETI